MIVPRWEWRTFGEDFGDAERRLAALPPSASEESDELYLLSLESDASVKVRDGADGRQAPRARRRRRARAVAAGHEGRVSAGRGGRRRRARGARVHGPPLPRATSTRSTSSSTRSCGPTPTLPCDRRPQAARALHVRRTAWPSSPSCERTRARARTIAIESEDPAASRGRARARPRRPPQRQRRRAGSRRSPASARGAIAVIDVGTNSVKFHVGERRADGAWQTIADRAEVTRLGEGLDETGRLDDEPIARTVEAIAAMVDEARRDGVVEIAAVGTAGLRLAANSDALIDAVRERTGVEVEVISGEEEARLAYLAATSGLGVALGSLVVFDTGGGSSQFTFGHDERVDERFSVNVGAVRFTERFGLDGVVDDETLSAARAAIARRPRAARRPARRPTRSSGMGGAITNLAAVKLRLATYDPDVVHGHGPRRAPRSTGRSSSTGRATRRRAPRDRRPPAEPRGGDPRRRLHRPHRARQARPRLADGQRPRPAPRPDRRALRAVGVRRARAGASARRSSEAAPSPVREPPRT